VKEAGKAGKVKIVAFDEEDDTLAGVKSGDIHATIVQQPFEFGYQSIKLMAEALSKGEGGKAATAGVFPENKVKIVPTLVIKKDGVEEFQTKINGLRGRTGA